MNPAVAEPVRPARRLFAPPSREGLLVCADPEYAKYRARTARLLPGVY